MTRLAAPIARRLGGCGRSCRRRVDQLGRRGAVRRVPAQRLLCLRTRSRRRAARHAGDERWRRPEPRRWRRWPGPVCTWEQSGVAGPAGEGDGGPFLDVVGTPSPGAEFYAEVCDGEYTGRVRWVPAGDPGTGCGRCRRRSNWRRSSGSGWRARCRRRRWRRRRQPGWRRWSGYPSFVSVTNWTGVVTDRECDPTGLLCVTVTATPSMRFVAGRAGRAGRRSAPVRGAVRSRRAIRSSRRPLAEACAYPYRLRTGVERAAGASGRAW